MCMRTATIGLKHREIWSLEDLCKKFTTLCVCQAPGLKEMKFESPDIDCKHFPSCIGVSIAVSVPFFTFPYTYYSVFAYATTMFCQSQEKAQYCSVSILTLLFNSSCTMSRFTPKDQDQAIKSLSADLRGIFAECDVPVVVQALIAETGLVKVRYFARVAEDIKEMREIIKTDIGVDPATGIEARLVRTQILAAWDLANKRIEQENEQWSQQAIANLPHTMMRSEHIITRDSVEAEYAADELSDANYPAHSYLEWRFTQIEENDCQAESLTKCASKDETSDNITDGAFGKDGIFRLHKTSRVEVPMPQNSEDFRRRIRILGMTFVAAKIKFPNCFWLKDVTKDTFIDYTDYILGEEIAGLRIHDEEGNVIFRPDFKTVLNYEWQIRKKACRLVLHDHNTWAQALKAASKDTTVRHKYLLTGMSLSAIAKLLTKGKGKGKLGKPFPQTYTNTFSGGYESGKGSFKGRKGVQNFAMKKGGKNGKSSGKGSFGKRGGNRLFHANTIDGRQICFAYNNKDQGCDGNCGRVHVCRICTGAHPAWWHWDKDHAVEAASGMA